MREVIMRMDGSGEESHGLERVGELVRCVDCKYLHLNGLIYDCIFGLPQSPEGFCSYGERKEDTV